MKRLLSSLLFGLVLPWVGVSAILGCVLFLMYATGFVFVVVLWLLAWAGFLLVLLLRRVEAPRPLA
ncbi:MULTISPECIES: hypothetical protein [unclassified Lysobacter]|uniref:hypothetical protein n=1 Tax=unclassified Lysobacter TaxID=2635362 RepID=UPI000B113B54|nr:MULTISPECIES: hypothetical protein [unclassified Lysobacter]